ncbi:type II-A CRISPR-associated protein Csn2 [Candidatus Nanosynbacter sp. TM7-053]|uniref:type II-A CRISPR-associated protein Csn2 n=1 Tax=Candidatus Nanosynbacter sp. TM7-053 TaxID=2902634 RepID=UPI001FB5B769|nr:type II-A CRISPR-associated protein Csn2 [Candidatus Nanosynbacter sp. TM7-053]MCJ1965422.1 type II-A CRISPR-associated protein Csn2 [Candidatus Nanosynbacter sp. TM7-053]
MRIKVSGFDNAVSIPENGGIATLAIHNDLFFRKIIENILDVYTKREENNRIVICDDNCNPLDITKDSLIITDIYSYDLSSRTITAALYKNIQDNSDIDQTKIEQIESSIFDILDNINIDFSQNLSYQSTISMNDILKMAHVGLEVNLRNNYIDRLYGIIDSARQLLSKQLVVLVNQRQLLSHSELRALLQYVEDNHFSVLFIEKICKDKLDSEGLLSIDDDFYDFSTNS